MVGTTISHYKVIEKIGQGGMGEVYRAEDTNLSRDVAIKVLPEQFTQDPQRLARFEREAKLLASLNHPNIAAIHSFEHTDAGQSRKTSFVKPPGYVTLSCSLFGLCRGKKLVKPPFSNVTR